MRTRGRGAAWIVALIVLPALAAGQSDGAAPSFAIPVADSQWPDVNLNVVVFDKQRAPQKVNEQEFKLLEDGTERPLRFLESPDAPASVALVIDSSGSIFKRKPEIISAVTAIVKALPADSEVMGVLFADQSFLDLPFTPASKVDFSFLDRLQARGPTALYDAVFATENYIVAHAKYARRALVILSDGEDNASHVSRGVVFRRMGQPDAPLVYACSISKARILQSELMAGHIDMKFLAERGGGTEFNLDPDPASTAAEIAAAIRSQYVLQFTAADPARDGKTHKLSVRLPVKDVEVHALPVYYAPAK